MNDMSNNLRQQIEKSIVRRVIREVRKVGWRPTETFDGGEYVKTTTEHEVLHTVFSVDDSTVSFRNKEGRIHGVKFVCGNCEDIVSDWHCGDAEFNAAMERVMGWIDAGVMA